jgi:hypothetical protein
LRETFTLSIVAIPIPSAISRTVTFTAIYVFVIRITLAYSILA